MSEKKKISSSSISSLDEFGHREFIHPAEVTGRFRTARTIVQSVLILIFLGLPWTTMNNHQTILLKIFDREFYFFGFILKAHNAPLLVFLLLGGTLSLAFLTAVWGRIWCGWACPQTVFIDGVFRRIEYLTEGNYLKRRQQKFNTLNFKSIIKKLIKWILFYSVSTFIAHSFLAYFVGSHEFYKMIQEGIALHLKLFLFTQALSLILLFNFAWFREQFCIIMCPYGRIQGLLTDSNSLVVQYDEKRSDCVNCNRCVNACPVGIDIRNGYQLECIGCTACIDACDEIMEKVNKPKNLIQYNTFSQLPHKILTQRSSLYLVGIIICLSLLVYNLSSLQHSEAFILRAKSDTFQIVTENNSKKIINQFRFHVTNQSNSDQTYTIQANNNNFKAELVSQMTELTLKPGAYFDWHFFIKVPFEVFEQKNKVIIEIFDKNNHEAFHKKVEVDLLGPIL